MMFLFAMGIMTGIFLGIYLMEIYLRRLHKLQQYIRRVQQGERRKGRK